MMGGTMMMHKDATRQGRSYTVTGGRHKRRGDQGRSRVRRKDVRLTRVLMKLMDIPTT